MSIRMRLFEDQTDFQSSAISDWDTTELRQLLTPSTKGDNYSGGAKGDNSPDSGVWSDSESAGQLNDSYQGISTSNLRRSLFPVKSSTDVTEFSNRTSRLPRRLLAAKRLADPEQRYEESPGSKRLRMCFNGCRIQCPEECTQENPLEPLVPNSQSAEEDSTLLRQPIQSHDVESSDKAPSKEDQIVQAVENLTSECLLVADGSREYTLPMIPSKHSDLRCISGETLRDVLKGDYSLSVDQLTIVDCRYPYEYQGGHIRGAVNLYTRDGVRSLLHRPVAPGNQHVIIFHCEFSSERGPKMLRYLRSEDRDLNKNMYPRLNFPEVYLLAGGYKDFYGNHSDVCEPRAYIPMLHKDHADDLRHFRVKSKSWTSGERQAAERRRVVQRSRRSMDF